MIAVSSSGKNGTMSIREFMSMKQVPDEEVEIIAPLTYEEAVRLKNILLLTPDEIMFIVHAKPGSKLRVKIKERA